MDYNDIDWLAQRFEQHADKFQKEYEERLEMYPDSDPSTELGFNLPRALASICKRLRDLENDYDTSKD